jgi:hypothetical protein
MKDGEEEEGGKIPRGFFHLHFYEGSLKPKFLSPGSKLFFVVV